jgi:hypothetical protein
MPGPTPTTLPEMLSDPAHARALELLADRRPLDEVIQALVSDGLTEEDAERTAHHAAHRVGTVRQQRAAWALFILLIVYFCIVVGQDILGMDPGVAFRGTFAVVRDLTFSLLMVRGFWKLSEANRFIRTIVAHEFIRKAASEGTLAPKYDY